MWKKKGLFVFIPGREAVSRFSFPSSPPVSFLSAIKENWKRDTFSVREKNSSSSDRKKAGMAWHCSVTFGDKGKWKNQVIKIF